MFNSECFSKIQLRKSKNVMKYVAIPKILMMITIFYSNKIENRLVGSKSLRFNFKIATCFQYKIILE